MQVVKRDGRVMEFCKDRIVDAIIKAMQQTPEGVDRDMAEKIAISIEKQLEDRGEVSVYELQDLVEKKLMASSRKEVATSYITYRYIRDIARKSRTKDVFLDIITSKSNYMLRRNNDYYETPSDMMNKFGAEAVKPYVDTFLLSKDTREADKFGFIDIISKYYYPTKSIHSFLVPAKVIEGSKNIEEAVDSLCVFTRKIRNEIDGNYSIPAIDFMLAPYVKKTYEEDITSLSKLLNKEYDLNSPKEYLYSEENDKDKNIQFAINKTVIRVKNSLKIFLNSIARSRSTVLLNSINYGTDISPEGRCIIREILDLNEYFKDSKEVFIQIWKKKRGVNYFLKDINYDLYEKAILISIENKFLNFLNLDATYNENKNMKEGEKEKYCLECSNIGDSRVFEDIYSKNKYSCGRGAVASVSLNLPKIALESLNNTKDMDTRLIETFMNKLRKYVSISLNSLLERFSFQSTAVKRQLSSIMSGIWIESENLNDNNTLEDVLKHGTLELGVVGLAECLVALNGKHHGEDEKSQELGVEIVSEIRKLLDEFTTEHNLNFCLMEAYDMDSKFIEKDKMLYGSIKGITDKQSYTCGFGIPIDYECEASKRAEIESPYHRFFNGGAKTIFVINEETKKDEIKTLLSLMDEYDLNCTTISN